MYEYLYLCNKVLLYEKYGMLHHKHTHYIYMYPSHHTINISYTLQIINE